MSKTTKIVIGIVILILVVWGISSSNKKVVDNGPIKIGISLPLTGNLAFIGETDRNAVELAKNEILNQKNLKHKYEFIVEDDSFDAAKAVSVMNKFISIDKVNAVISIGSTAGNVIAPIAESNKIPHIGMASDPVVAKGDFNFIHWTRPQEEVDSMINELQKRNINKVAVIGVNQQGFQAINEDFKEKAKTANITVLNEIFNPGQTDFKTIILKLKEQNPQIYLIGAFDPEVEIIGKQIKSLGIKTPLTSIESFGITSDPKPFEGQWYIDSASPTNIFNDSYQNKYNKTPGPAAANVYDAIHILVNAFENIPENNNTSGEQIVKSLNEMKEYNGALGNLSINKEGAFISKPSVKIIKNGQAVNM